MQSDIHNPRRHVGIHAEHISDVSSRDFPGHYPGEDSSWNLDHFRKVRTRSLPLASFIIKTYRSPSQNLHVKVNRLSQRSVQFDLVGVDASIANAFRRILIAEVRYVRSASPSGKIFISSSYTRSQQSPSNMYSSGITLP
jgi:DNA-directed RNA polymerase I and III subunit RPAC1